MSEDTDRIMSDYHKLSLKLSLRQIQSWLWFVSRRLKHQSDCWIIQQHICRGLTTRSKHWEAKKSYRLGVHYRTAFPSTILLPEIIVEGFNKLRGLIMAHKNYAETTTTNYLKIPWKDLWCQATKCADTEFRMNFPSWSTSRRRLIQNRNKDEKCKSIKPCRLFSCCKFV